MGDKFADKKIAVNGVSITPPGMASKVHPLADDIMLFFKSNVTHPAKMAEQLKHVELVTDDRDLTWAHIYCPEVVAYFDTIRYFDFVPHDFDNLNPPIFTTEAAIEVTCQLKIVRDVAKRINAVSSELSVVACTAQRI